MLIGVCGRKRHGKDSIGNRLVEAHGFVRRSFAYDVKRIGMLLLGLTRDQVNGVDFDREAALPGWDGLTTRQALQGIGDGLRERVHPEVWIRSTLDSLPRDRDCVITDVRYPNEAQAIRDMGGVIWKVVRPCLADDDTHPSEVGVGDIEPDALLGNDGTLEQLTDAVDLAMAILAAS